jgi:hypothetical protein
MTMSEASAYARIAAMICAVVACTNAQATLAKTTPRFHIAFLDCSNIDGDAEGSNDKYFERAHCPKTSSHDTPTQRAAPPTKRVLKITGKSHFAVKPTRKPQHRNPTILKPQQP